VQLMAAKSALGQLRKVGTFRIAPEAGIGIVLRGLLIEIWIAIATAFADEVWRSLCGEIVVLVCIRLALKEHLGVRRRTIHRPQAGSRR
jgi:hypothetical protein